MQKVYDKEGKEFTVNPVDLDSCLKAGMTVKPPAPEAKPVPKSTSHKSSTKSSD